jgi:asparagine synthase (glutamine-hydrolysing)
MCGIVGIMSKDGTQPSIERLELLSRAVAHRGPDGAGQFVGGGVCLAQRRLAIIDLAGGDQPLYGPGQSVLVANGEIYNYIEIKRDFASATFRTNSDCEVPLVTYGSSGADFARELRGMYAIALFDQKKQTLHLARDPFGIKPLYYTESGNAFAFASEAQALVQAGLARAIAREQAAVELLQTGRTTDEETIHPAIKRVLPGETLTVRDGRIVARHTQQALPAEGPLLLDEDDALARLDNVLMNSVEVHQRSDVPYGMFLSGGVDSSALLACMARLNEKPVRTFTAGFAAASTHDEREHARSVAKAVGARHTEIEIDERDFWTHLPAIVKAIDDPIADYAIVPTFLLARAASKELKVVLCGEGGDELFAGYGRYRRLLRPWWLGGRSPERQGKVDLHGVLRASPNGRAKGSASVEDPSRRPQWSALQQAQAQDCRDWLPDQLLIKLDRCLMKHALEGRTPFLDSAVADLAFRLPDALKIKAGLGKYLLRKWLAQHLPQAEPFARKRGFTVPVGEWISSRATTLGQLVARNQGIQQICHAEAVEKLFRSLQAAPGKHASVVGWRLLFYALWHRVHVEGAPCDGDVFSVL